MSDIKVGWAIFFFLVDRKALIRTSAGRLERQSVKTLAKAVVDIEIQAFIETGAQACQQPVEVCVDIGPGKIGREDIRIL